MKKGLLLILFLYFFCGCKKIEKYSCVYENKVEDNLYTTTIDLKIEDEMVIFAQATMSYEDIKIAENMCEVFKLAQDAKDNLECNGRQIILNNYHHSLNKGLEVSKESFFTYMDNREFICNKK